VLLGVVDYLVSLESAAQNVSAVTKGSVEEENVQAASESQ
jgi:hypothetical protein